MLVIWCLFVSCILELGVSMFQVSSPLKTQVFHHLADALP